MAVHTSCYSYQYTSLFYNPYIYMYVHMSHVIYSNHHHHRFCYSSVSCDVCLFPDSYTCTCSFSIAFNRVNRTFCQQDTSADVDDVLAYIDVFTSFSENVIFSIVFEPVGNYTFRYFITSPTYTLRTIQS